MTVVFRPMPLVRIPQPFDHSDMLWEIKFDGFRAVASVDRGRCSLTSRNGYPFKRWAPLCAEIVRDLRAESAVLDGEIVNFDRDGHVDFYNLMFRRGEPSVVAFDLLAVDGEDLTSLPLIDRKRRLRTLAHRRTSRVRYFESVPGRGLELFALACEHDLEGIVGKWMDGAYQTAHCATSWVKVKNGAYTQMEGRHELFERRRAFLGDQSPRQRPRLVWS